MQEIEDGNRRWIAGLSGGSVVLLAAFLGFLPPANLLMDLRPPSSEPLPMVMGDPSPTPAEAPDPVIGGVELAVTPADGTRGETDCTITYQVTISAPQNARCSGR